MLANEYIKMILTIIDVKKDKKIQTHWIWNKLISKDGAYCTYNDKRTRCIVGGNRTVFN